MSAHLTADQKPDLLALQDENQPSLPKLNNCKGLACHDHACTGLSIHCTFNSVTKNKNKSPTKLKRAPTVKQETIGTSSTKSASDEFNPTSRDMAYHYILIALEKVTLETRKEIAEKLNVK
jgi:hypothetical protein